MSHESLSRETTFGYLSTLQSPDHGYFGGYLLVSAYGRPLEFHCTSPVRPSRAQEILYGPTLKPYLLGEQISGALLAAAKLTPSVILADQAGMMAVRPQSDVPMVLVLSRTEDFRLACPVAIAGTAAAASSAQETPTALRWIERRFAIGGYDLQLPAGYESDEEEISRSLTLLSKHVDLAEPFGRIHDAIQEAQRIGQRTSEAHGQAA